MITQTGPEETAILSDQSSAGAEETLEQRTRELALLNRASQAFTSTLELNQVLATVLEEVRRLLGVAATSVWLKDPDTGALVCRQATGAQSDAVRGWQLHPGQGLAGWVARTGEGLIVPDAQKDARHFKDMALLNDLPLHSILTVPLLVKGSVIGVLQVVDTRVDRFSEKDRELLESLAASAAIAIENAQLYDETERLRAFNENIVRSMEEGILIEDVTGHITFFNPSIAHLLEYEGDALQGRHWTAIVAPDALPVVAEQAAQRPQGIAGRYEAVLLSRTGRRVPVIVGARPLFEGDEFVGVLSVFTDISELKQAERALRESESRYRILSDLTSDFAYAFHSEADGGLALEWMTEAVTQITGYTLEEMRGEVGARRDWTSFIHPDDQESARQYREDILSGESMLRELRIITKDGETRWLHIHSHPRWDENRTEIVGIVGAAQDITERKQAEEVLKRRNEDLIALNAIITILGQPLDLSQTLGMTLDRLLEMVDAAGGWIELMAPDRDPVTAAAVPVAERGLSPEQADPALTVEQRRELISAVAESGQVMTICQDGNGPVPYASPDGDVCSLAGIPIKSRERVLGVLGLFASRSWALRPREMQLLTAIAHQIGSSIENARLSEEASEIEILRELSRLRSELIANVSHELRTPLGLIKFFGTSLLMDDVEFDRETRIQFLRGIDAETDRLEVIVDNLLDLSRVESGRLQLDRRLTNVTQLVKEILATMSAELELEGRAADYRFICDFPPAPLTAPVDVRRIEQVLRNLLNNAVKYSPAGGTITVQGRGDEDQILICVQDQGMGIPPQDLKRVFERFYRVENDITQRTRGAGLGLAVCRSIIDAHGGAIWAESTLGEESAFYFTLPSEQM